VPLEDRRPKEAKQLVTKHPNTTTPTSALGFSRAGCGSMAYGYGYVLPPNDTTLLLLGKPSFLLPPPTGENGARK